MGDRFPKILKVVDRGESTVRDTTLEVIGEDSNIYDKERVAIYKLVEVKTMKITKELV